MNRTFFTILLAASLLTACGADPESFTDEGATGITTLGMGGTDEGMEGETSGSNDDTDGTDEGDTDGETGEPEPNPSLTELCNPTDAFNGVAPCEWGDTEAPNGNYFDMTCGPVPTADETECMALKNPDGGNPGDYCDSPDPGAPNGDGFYTYSCRNSACTTKHSEYGLPSHQEVLPDSLCVNNPDVFPETTACCTLFCKTEADCEEGMKCFPFRTDAGVCVNTTFSG